MYGDFTLQVLLEPSLAHFSILEVAQEAVASGVLPQLVRCRAGYQTASVAPRAALLPLPPREATRDSYSGLTQRGVRLGQLSAEGLYEKERLSLVLGGLNWFIPEGEWEEVENASKLGRSWQLTQRQGRGRGRVGQNGEQALSPHFDGGGPFSTSLGTNLTSY